MFYKILVTLLAIDSILLVAAILLQAGKGGGLANTFGGSSSSADAIMGTRQAGNLLTKISWWTGGIFIGLAFMISLSTAKRSAPKSVLDQTFSAPPSPVTAPAATAPAGGASVLPVQPAPTDAKSAPADAKSKAPATKTKTP